METNINLYKLFDESNSLSEVLKKLSLSDNIKNWNKVKEIAKDINFDIDEYKRRKYRYCLKCKIKLNKGQKKFCSRSCSRSFHNKKHSEETKNKIRESINALYKNDNKDTKLNKKEKIKPIKILNNKKRTINGSLSFCTFCGKEIDNNKKYCDMICVGKHNHQKKYDYYLLNQEEFNRSNYSPKSFKDFFLKEQDYKCSICGCDNKWNNKTLIFVTDHINGDSSDNRRSNLRLICPNCDSQTDTFKSKNKNSKRRDYFREKTKEKIYEELKLTMGM